MGLNGIMGTLSVYVVTVIIQVRRLAVWPVKTIGKMSK